MFWIDEIIKEIINRINKDSFIITDWTTPSGHAHIGALRGVIVHNCICQGLIDKNKQATFQYGFDDFDPMDGRPVYIDKSWDKYMGMSLSKVPAPDYYRDCQFLELHPQCNYTITRIAVIFHNVCDFGYNIAVRLWRTEG